MEYQVKEVQRLNVEKRVIEVLQELERYGLTSKSYTISATISNLNGVVRFIIYDSKIRSDGYLCFEDLRKFQPQTNAKKIVKQWFDDLIAEDTVKHMIKKIMEVASWQG